MRKLFQKAKAIAQTLSARRKARVQKRQKKRAEVLSNYADAKALVLKHIKPPVCTQLTQTEIENVWNLIWQLRKAGLRHESKEAIALFNLAGLKYRHHVLRKRVSSREWNEAYAAWSRFKL